MSLTDAKIALDKVNNKARSLSHSDITFINN